MLVCPLLIAALLPCAAGAGGGARIGPFSFLGPFQRGKTELDGEPVVRSMHVGDKQRYYSELSPHLDGKVGWSAVPYANQDGTVVVRPEAGQCDFWLLLGWFISESF